MNFIEVLDSEYYYLIEAIEHCEDDNLKNRYISELEVKTGYRYKI
jgi:hypothetical protein